MDHMIPSIYWLAFCALFLFAGTLPKSETQICGNTYRNKDNGFLFQDIKTLTINCDATFTWKHYSCTQRDTSWGTWKLVNGEIELTSDKALIKALEKEAFPKSIEQYIDLSKSTLTLYDSFVVWKRTEDWTDTLYK